MPYALRIFVEHHEEAAAWFQGALAAAWSDGYLRSRNCLPAWLERLTVLLIGSVLGASFTLLGHFLAR
jgi:hypothetical protein